MPKHLIIIIGYLMAMAYPVWAQSPTPGEGQTREKVKNGDNLQGEPDNKNKKADAPKTVVRETSVCDLFDEAARGDRTKEFKKYSVHFWGHEPWMAELVCDYIKGAAGDAKNPGAFGCRRSDNEGKAAEKLLPTEYEARRVFLAKVLDAYNAHSGGQWKTQSCIPPTANIAQNRLLVGKRLYKNLEVSEEHPEKLSPKKTDRFVARSLEVPDSFLLGMCAEDFWGPRKDRQITEKGGYMAASVAAWLNSAEEFLLRAHAMAVAAALVSEENGDSPSWKMVTDVAQISEKFKDKYGLKNSKDYKASKTAEEQADRNPEPGFDLEKVKGDAKKDRSVVELTIQSAEVPAKDARSADVPGISLFVYAPIGGPEHGDFNPRDWFVKYLADLRGDVEPGGITLPIWTIRKRGPQGLAFADRMFDETTKVPVETRFDATAVCVARIHYYKHPAENGTERVLAHERRHFDGIRDAWSGAMQALQNSLRDLAQDLNNSLGNLQGAEAFALTSSEFRDVWRIDPNDPELTAIPEGPIRQPKAKNDFDNRLFRLHSNKKVSYLRFRLARRLPAGSTSRTLLEMIESGGKLQSSDQLFEQAQKIFKDWESAHWKDDKSNEFRNLFAREFILAALRLDIREGQINKNGEQSGDRRLNGSVERFQEELRKNPNKDPLELMPKR